MSTCSQPINKEGRSKKTRRRPLTYRSQLSEVLRREPQSRNAKIQLINIRIFLDIKTYWSWTTWWTKQKNTSVRQRQKIESLIGQDSREEKRKTKEVSLIDQNENPRKTGKIKRKIPFENNLTAFAKTCARRLLADWLFPDSLAVSFKIMVGFSSGVDVYKSWNCVLFLKSFYKLIPEARTETEKTTLLFTANTKRLPLVYKWL